MRAAAGRRSRPRTAATSPRRSTRTPGHLPRGRRPPTMSSPLPTAMTIAVAAATGAGRRPAVHPARSRRGQASEERGEEHGASLAHGRRIRAYDGARLSWRALRDVVPCGPPLRDDATLQAAAPPEAAIGPRGRRPPMITIVTDAVVRRVRGLLFDMDGTMVDSMAVTERTWNAWAASNGVGDRLQHPARPAGRRHRAQLPGCRRRHDRRADARAVAQRAPRPRHAADARCHRPAGIASTASPCPGRS